MMRRIIIMMVLSAIGLVIFSTTDHSVAQDGSGERLSVGDFAPIGPENVLYLEAISELDPELDEPILSVAFSPENASFMATTEKSVLFWSVEGALNGVAPMMRLEVEDGEWLETVFSEDQGLVAIGTGSGIEVWDTVNVEQIGAFEGERERGQVMAFSGDGEVFVYQLGENLRYWDTVEWVELASRLLTEPIVLATFSPDGQFIAFKLEDSTVRVEFLDFPDIDRVATIEHGMIEEITPLQMAFSPGGRWLFIYGESTMIQAWDTETWTLERNIELIQYVWRIEYLEFSPDGHFMVAGGWNTPFHRWELDETSGEITALPREDTGGVITNVGFTSDSSLLSAAWSIGADISLEAVYILDPISGRSYVAHSADATWMDRSVEFSSDNRLLAFPLGEYVSERTAELRTIGFYGVPNATLEASTIVPAFEVPELPPTTRVRISSETVGDIELTNTVNMWDVAGQEPWLPYSFSRYIRQDSNRMLLELSTYDYDVEQYLNFYIYEWDFVNSPQLIQTIPGCDCDVISLRYLPDGRAIVLFHNESTEQTSAIALENMTTLSSIDAGNNVRYGFTPDQSQVVVFEDIEGVTTYRLWTIETGEQQELTEYSVLRSDGKVRYSGGLILDAETGEVLHEYATDFSYPDAVQVMLTGIVVYGSGRSFILEDGRQISTTDGGLISPDQSIIARVIPANPYLVRSLKLIELVDTGTGETLAMLDLGEDEFYEQGSIYFTPDGTRLIYVSLDGDIRVWEIRE